MFDFPEFLNFEKKELVYSTKVLFKTYIKDPSNNNSIFLRTRIRKYRKLLDKEGFETKKILKTIQNLSKARNALEFYKKKEIKQNVKFLKNKCIINSKLFYKGEDEIIFRSFSDLLSVIGRSYYPPRSKKVLNLISKMKKTKFTKCTLGGCIIERKNGFIYILKEAKNKKLTYFDQKNNKHFVPAVVEASAGVDRAMLTILADAFNQEEVNGENRTVMKLSPKIAPIKVAVFPLMNKLGMPELGEKLIDDLRNNDIASFYDTGGSIGKRYRRQDEAGTPFGLTVDHDTLEDNTITLRDRDTMEQERISVDKVVEVLKTKL